MDGIRTVGAAAGFRWVWDAINIGRRGAGAIFGGAGLLLLAAIGAMIGMMIAMAGAFAAMGPSPSVSMVASLVCMILLLLGMAFGIVGYLRLIDAVESGRGASATDAFRGFGDLGTGIRTFAVLLLVMIVQQALMIGFIAWFMPELGRWYLDVLHGAGSGAPPPALPSAFWKVYPLSMAVSLVSGWVQSIAIAQMALGRRGIGGALRDGVVSLVRNVPALLVLIGVAIAFAVAFLVIALLAVAAVALVAKLVATWLAVVLALVLYVVSFVAMVAVGCASMYYMWRDIAGPDDAPAQAIAA
jgi:hypothetical protein